MMKLQLYGWTMKQFGKRSMLKMYGSPSQLLNVFWSIDLTQFRLIHQESVAGTWELCTGRIIFDHDTGSMIKYHKNLTSRGIRALIFRYICIYNVSVLFCLATLVWNTYCPAFNERGTVVLNKGTVLNVLCIPPSIMFLVALPVLHVQSTLFLLTTLPLSFACALHC